MTNHNHARWLKVAWLPTQGGRHHCPPNVEGWYVVRTCKCHHGERVTIPLPSQQHANRARTAMLNTSKELAT